MGIWMKEKIFSHPVAIIFGIAVGIFGWWGTKKAYDVVKTYNANKDKTAKTGG